MNTTKTRIALLALVALTATASAAYDPNHFDPNNAAHWYRKAFESLEPFDFNAISKYFTSRHRIIESDSDTRKIEQQFEDNRQLREYIHGEIELTDNIERQVKKEVVDLFIKASKCRVCDWGYGNLENPSEEKVLQYISETSMLLDGLQLVLASSIISAENDQPHEAVEQWAAAFAVNKHHYFDTSLPYGRGDRDIISCAQRLLSLLANHPAVLEKISTALDNFIHHRPSIAKGFDETTENFVKIIISDQDSNNRHMQTAKGLVLEGKFNINHYRNYRKELRKAWLLPYAKAIPEIEHIRNKYSPDPNKTPVEINAYIISIYEQNILSQRRADTLFRTTDNAVYIASTVYLYHAKNRKLPQKLPPDMPKDLYSDKPFLIIKTENGFKLKCQGENLYNKIHEYEFKFPGD